MMKLTPMKPLERSARTIPFTMSVDTRKAAAYLPNVAVELAAGGRGLGPQVGAREDRKC
jgi:hypothetical protein